jgi:nitrogen fixation uncharacterized protein
MSVQTVRDFWQKVRQEPALLTKLQQIKDTRAASDRRRGAGTAAVRAAVGVKSRILVGLLWK